METDRGQVWQDLVAKLMEELRGVETTNPQLDSGTRSWSFQTVADKLSLHLNTRNGRNGYELYGNFCDAEAGYASVGADPETGVWSWSFPSHNRADECIDIIRQDLLAILPFAILTLKEAIAADYYLLNTHADGRPIIKWDKVDNTYRLFDTEWGITSDLPYRVSNGAVYVKAMTHGRGRDRAERKAVNVHRQIVG